MIWGILTLVLIVEPVINEELLYRYNRLVGREYTLGPKVVTSAEQTTADRLPTPAVDGRPKTEDSQTSLGSVLSGGRNVIVPLSTDFGIVIEKINANAKVVPNVDPGDENAYTNALGEGVAHAKGTVFPGQKGNVYLFSHSVDSPWNFVRYNAVFYLLNKLENGDSINIFFQGRRYDYRVYDKVIVSPLDTQYITNKYDEEILTLQTCDPPGTLLNRLVIRAKLAKS